MAKIAIEGMQFFGYHGVYASEKEKGNDFVVDVYVDAKISKAADSDDLGDTVDYVKVYDLVKKEMEGSGNLLETIVKKIAKKILKKFPQVTKVKARVSKLKPPVGGIVKRTYVEETRSRK